MLFSIELAFVGREEIRAPLKRPPWEASCFADLNTLLLKCHSKRLIRLFRVFSFKSSLSNILPQYN